MTCLQNYGRTNGEYDAIQCKVKTTAACAKEAYEFLDAVIQNDNASPTVQRPLVANHDDGTASIYYQGRAINVASKSDVGRAGVTKEGRCALRVRAGAKIDHVMPP